MTFRHLLAVVGLCAVAACQPLPASYTAAEAPKTIALSNATQHFAVRFEPGSARLVPADAARLRRWAEIGAIAPGDRVTVAAAGAPGLAAARVGTLSRELLRYRIAVGRFDLASLAPNRAVIDSERYLVTTPACPDWSKPAEADLTNEPGSNFGCATTSNLALMVADPADLVRGRTLSPANGTLSAEAVNRYENGTEYMPSTFNSAVSSAVQGAVSSTASH